MCFALASVSAANAQDEAFGDLSLPGISQYAPADRKVPLEGTDSGVLLLDARLTDEGEPLEDGMIWRVFDASVGDDGKLPLIAVAKGGAARIELAPGNYLVHAAFGRAGATARIALNKETRRESLVLNAGGLKLDAALPDGSQVRRNKLSFDIFSRTGNADEDQLILPDVPAGRTIRLNAGTYHIVSKYGSINAVTRADLRVEAGRTTEASLEHRAAQVTLNLVRGKNGFPLADTAWSVIAPSGDVIREDVSAISTMILLAGEYTIVAQNKDNIYQKNIEVLSGRDQTIRVEATEENRLRN